MAKDMDRTAPPEGYLKCCNCGHQVEWDGKDYESNRDCQLCDNQMLSYRWAGWESTPERERMFAEEERQLAEKDRLAKIEASKPEFQLSEPFGSFTQQERTVGKGITIIKAPGDEAPILSAFGAALVRVYGIRRKDGIVQFGVGNEEPPILDWIEANDFFDEWPD
jgi:hypothetical protein